MTSLTEKEPTRPGGRGARTRILNAASELFYFEGINATGVGRIASKASVSKRTLYQHFPSKTALVEEYLRQLRQEAGEAEGTPAAEAGHDTTCAAACPLRYRGWRRRTDAGMSVSQRGGRGGRGHAGESSASSTCTSVTTSMASLTWPDRRARRTRRCWATRSRCSMRVRLHCRPRSTIRRPGRVPERRRRPSFRCGCRCQNRVVDRGRRDCDDGFLGATDEI